MNGLAALKRAGEQFGVVTRAQALEFMSVRQLEYRLRTKQWVRVFPQVFRVEGAPTDWRQSLTALTLWAGRKSALSHRTAAALHGFTRFEAGPLDLTVIRHRRAPAGVTLFQADGLVKKDLTDVDGFTVTSVARTLVDLAADSERSVLRDTVDQALREKKTTLEALAATMKRSKHRQGMTELRALVHELSGGDGPTESEAETLALELMEQANLPKPERQRVVAVKGQFRRLDLLFRAQRVVVEVDGYAYHSGVSNFEDDRERNNSLVARGLVVLHWTWEAMQTRPE